MPSNSVSAATPHPAAPYRYGSGPETGKDGWVRAADRNGSRTGTPFHNAGRTFLAGACRLGALAVLMLGVLPSPGRAAEIPCPATAPRPMALPATRAALSAEHAARIVAFGSSSTEGAGATTPDRAYPARLEAFLHQRWPGVAVTVVNLGRGGQAIDDMVERLATEVLPLRPTLVIWQAGANDTLRGTAPVRFAALLDEGVRRLAAAGSDVVLMDNQVAPRLAPEISEGVYGLLLAREAADRSVALFPRGALMRQWLSEAMPDVPPMIGADGLHHTDRGYACLAAALGESILAATGPVPAGTATAQGPAGRGSEGRGTERRPPPKTFPPEPSGQPAPR